MKKFMIVFSCYKQKNVRADNGETRKTPKRTSQVRQKVFATLMMLDDAVNVCLSSVIAEIN